MREKLKNNKPLRIVLIVVLVMEIIFLIGVGAYMIWQNVSFNGNIDYGLGRPKKEELKTGKILEESPLQNFTAEETLALIHQTNKDLNANDIKYPISKQIFRYTSSDNKGNDIPIYGRVYKPSSFNGKTAIFAFAPGTTGIGDQCAASLEQPATKNWANYDSLLASYATQGYTVVTTDYEGMRDPDRLHHYMVGELEGRAVLDSVRALSNLTLTKNKVDTSKLIVSGYSQGGHAAFWADKISKDYTPELKPTAVVGFGPVDDVEKTLSDITKGANINWFGPYVLVSYRDYYKADYQIEKILLPKWQTNLTKDVLNNCVDTVSGHWGTKSDGVYTKEFLNALRDKRLLSSQYPQLAYDMRKNIAGDVKTNSVKLINQGALDNVVLADQQTQMINRMCSSGNRIVNYKLYPKANHYNTMVISFRDTISWLSQAQNNSLSQSDCK